MATMATMATKVTDETMTGPAVLRPVEAPAAVCGECMFHIAHVTIPGGWCACEAAELRWKPVSAGRTVCSDFAAWPVAGPAPAFLAAMGS